MKPKVWIQSDPVWMNTEFNLRTNSASEFCLNSWIKTECIWINTEKWWIKFRPRSAAEKWLKMEHFSPNSESFKAIFSFDSALIQTVIFHEGILTLSTNIPQLSCVLRYCLLCKKLLQLTSFPFYVNFFH